MKDEHREKLDRRLTPIQLFKLTPRTNCGECGQPACLAFATQVIVGQADLDACPYLDREALGPFRAHLEDQHRAGIGVRREGFEKALHFLREEIKKWKFKTIAASLGAEYREAEGGPVLDLIYLGRPVTVTREDVIGPSEDALDPYEKIFIFNYVIGGATEPSGTWVGMESLPNSVSKIKSLKAHCEDRLAEAFAGKIGDVPAAAESAGPAKVLADGEADRAVELQVLPRLAIRILWWDEDRDEGFKPRSKFLFDSRVLQVLDLESLLFACEKLTDRLLGEAH